MTTGAERLRLCACALALLACGDDAGDAECGRGAYANNALLYSAETGRHELLVVEPEALRGYTRVEGAVTIDGDVDLAPLHCLREIGGGLAVFHRDLPMDGLQQLESLGATLQIDSNGDMPDLRSLSGLTSIGTLSVNSNQALQSLDGLSELREIGGDLQIGANASMVSLDGLHEVHVRGGIAVLGNPMLRDVTGLSAVKSLGSLQGPSLEHWGSVNFDGNPQLSACEVDAAVAELEMRGLAAAGSNCGNLADGCGEATCP